MAQPIRPVAQHARLTWQTAGDDDLRSLNGTFVNEVKVTPARPVSLKTAMWCRMQPSMFILSD